MSRRKMTIIKLFCALSIVACVTFPAEAMKRSYDKISKDLETNQKLMDARYEELNKEFEDVDKFTFEVELESRIKKTDKDKKLQQSEKRKEEAAERRKKEAEEKVKNAKKEAFVFTPILGQPSIKHIGTPMPKKQERKTENKIVEQKVDKLIQQRVNTDLFRAQQSKNRILNDYSNKPVELCVQLDTLIAAEDCSAINKLYSSIGKSYQLASYWPVGTLIYNLRMNPYLRLDSQLINDAYNNGHKKTYTINQLEKVLKTLERHKLNAVKKLADEKKLVESK
jgi:hypothetical protein